VDFGSNSSAKPGPFVARLPFPPLNNSPFSVQIIDEIRTWVIPCFSGPNPLEQSCAVAIPSNGDLFYTPSVVICKVGCLFFNQPEKSLGTAQSFKPAFFYSPYNKSLDAQGTCAPLPLLETGKISERRDCDKPL
jgi:hypothetical protein